MKIGINEYGLVERFDSETVHIVLPDKNGGRPEYAGISDQIQLDWPMVSGDVIQCQMAQNPSKKSIYPLVVQTVSGLNGLDEKDATVRPMPRSNRHYAERISPSKSFLDSLSQHDIALRMIEYRCPMAFGNSVVIAGPHGAGSTQLLMKIMSHFQSTHSADHAIILCANGRSEEATEWRRLMPEAEVVVLPNAMMGGSAEEAVKVANLVFECAKRQTELDRNVVLAIDTMSSLWAAMLESESADAQREADRSVARKSVKDWVRSAGDFGGEGLLGSRLGGSLTILMTVWNIAIDTEAEEDGELHPNLRLLEHLASDADVQIYLDEDLKRDRMFPAIDLHKSSSKSMSDILGEEAAAGRGAYLQELSDHSTKEAYSKLRSDIEVTNSNASIFSASKVQDTRSLWDSILPL